MIRNLVARFTLMALPFVACGRSSQPADSSTAEALELAKARAQDLANSTQNYQPVRFVSAIEQVRPPRPVRKRRVDEVVRKAAELVRSEPVALPSPAPDVVEQAAPMDSASALTTAPRVPSIIPRAAPSPEAVAGSGAATGDWRGTDPGPDMGTVIGVVLRGGRGDPGHCPRHPRPPSQIPTRIPR